MGFDFTYTEDQLPYKETIRKFVENEIVPLRKQYDESEKFPWKSFAKCRTWG